MVRCSGNQNTFTDYELPKEKSAAPDWMVERLRTDKRQKCNTCSPPPIWKTESGNFDMPAGPEVSYGIPFRWSASRLLAADVREMVCGSRHNQTQECNSLLNLREGGAFSSREDFARGFFGPDNLAQSLFSFKTTENWPDIKEAMLNFSRELEDTLDEELFLWGGKEAPGWIACTQANSTCYGTMTKSEWYNRDIRAQKCNAVFEEQVRLGRVNSTAQGIDICNLNSRTEELCKILQTARINIAQANCIYAGSCADKLFVYTPGMYSSSNRDFVRTTVLDFYEMFGRSGEAFSFTNTTWDEEKVCPLDDFEMELKVRNEAMKTSCASVQLDTMKKALRMVRIVVDKIAEAVYIEFQIIICFFRLLIPNSSSEDIQQVVVEIQFWFNKLITFMIKAVEELANILYQIVFDTGPFGQALKVVIEILCFIVWIIIQAWNYFICHVLKIFVVPLLEGLVSIIEGIVSIIGQGWEVVNGLRELVRMMYDMNCDVQVNCTFPQTKTPGIEFGALPVATRCWADYSPEIDSTDAFSCTRSDTCRVSELDYGTSLDYKTGLLLEDGNQIVCDQVTPHVTLQL